MTASVDTASPHAALGEDRTEGCVACGEADLEPFLDLGRVPVATTSLYRTAEEAQRSPTGEMRLHVCPRCGLVRNVAFQESLVAYDTEYENSQHFSPTFRRYVEALADRLIATHGLRGATIADLGCGKGEFLALLAERASGAGIGFDPTYDGEVDASSRIRIHREFFPRDGRDLDVQLVSCRHVLEHLPAPDIFLESLRRSLPIAVPVYFEVPNAAHVLTASGMWDLIYQHVSYFDASSMAALFSRCGFTVTRLADAFGGQYLALDAVAGPAHIPTRDPTDLTSAFPDTFARVMRSWERFATENADRRTVLWGAGAKGVSFLSLSPAGALVQAVVDVNRRKQGFHVPGSGLEIVSPDRLLDLDPEVVLVANPIYLAEIRSALADLAPAAHVVPL